MAMERLTNPRVVRFSVVLSALVALAAIGGYWRLRVDCECAPSKFEKTTYLYKITHLQRFATRYYGQFYEDFVLGYVFRNEKTGFYIDVGANDPNRWNSTKYFYERGWRGINIEPNVLLFKRIVQFRPRDINYNVGIAATEGTMTFYQAPAGKSDGLSTFVRDDADRLRREQGMVFTELPVQVTTLDALLAKTSSPSISFVSIDVEGFEPQVIEGFDLARYRPAVLCIEATQPKSEIAVYGAWEPRVLKHYLFAMTDGLNRYYVHRSRPDLLERFIFIDMCVKKSKLTRHVKMDGFTSWTESVRPGS